MNILITFLYVIFFTLIFLKSEFFRDDILKPKWFAGVFILKCICGMFLLWLYFQKGIGGDSFAFFQNGENLLAIFKSDTSSFFKIIFGINASDAAVMHHYKSLPLWFNNDVLPNDNRSMIRLNALIRIFSFGFFSVHIIFFCFLSMAGLIALYRFFKSFDPEKSKLIFIAVFLIPSVLFWTSGIFKESYLTFVLGFFLLTIKNISAKKNIWLNSVASIALFFLLCYIKIYFIIALMPAIIVFILCRHQKTIPAIAIAVGVYIVVFAIAVGAKYVDSRFDVFKLIADKQYNFVEFAKSSNANSKVEIPRLYDTLLSVLENSPVAFWNVLNRPYLWECKSFFWAISSIENILILIAILIVIFNFTLNKKAIGLSIALMLFSISLFILIGLTTPVLGSLIRYRSPVLIFFMMFFVMNTSLDEKYSFLKIN